MKKETAKYASYIYIYNTSIETYSIIDSINISLYEYSDIGIDTVTSYGGILIALQISMEM